MWVYDFFGFERKYILAVKAPTSISKDQVEKYARSQTRKAEQPATLYFFEDGSEIPAPGISAAGHFSAE